MDQSKIDIDQRKSDHIQLAFNAKVTLSERDDRFIYEPLLAAHPDKEYSNLECLVFDKKLSAPIWVSSMTGGTGQAFMINHRLATMCKNHRLGMGLGSIRPLLEDSSRFKDFNLRPIIGHDLPFFANLGVAQIEELLKFGKLDLLKDILNKLQVDGLIIHVNPLQEFLQPEGDRFIRSPFETIRDYCDSPYGKTIVKEVGQGMGEKSLTSLMSLPINGIELAAIGGTNFSKLELQRGTKLAQDVFQDLIFVGHSAEEMIDHLNKIVATNNKKSMQIIISGGINSILDGHYLLEKCQLPSVIGVASNFLKYALKSEKELDEYVFNTKKALSISRMMLTLRESRY
ncbi:MAG: type 2 isopentenyl-diphosphate Delta-isomerase [Bacteriovoracaceae bacterium]|jgi:isopentenyl-diphosphate Delta-isomerase|nr:type 2 isopentenyl-diphosphate Delta-isomerase [Bacteriovoracaceae bacterium]